MSKFVVHYKPVGRPTSTRTTFAHSTEEAIEQASQWGKVIQVAKVVAFTATTRELVVSE